MKFDYKCIKNEEIIINKQSKENINSQLEKLGLKKMESNGIFNENGNYNYLINMPIYSLTLEKKIDLEKEYNTKEDEYQTLFKKSEKEIWNEELQIFENSYSYYVKEKDKKYKNEIKIQKKKK